MLDSKLLSLTNLFLAKAALAAGFIYSVAAKPNASSANLLGSNMLAPIDRTINASKTYLKSVKLPYNALTSSIYTGFTWCVVSRGTQ